MGRLAITLQYLVTGDSMQTISFNYRVGHCTLCGIIGISCDALWEAFSPEYLQSPTIKLEWKMLVKDSTKPGTFPMCWVTLHAQCEISLNGADIMKDVTDVYLFFVDVSTSGQMINLISIFQVSLPAPESTDSTSSVVNADANIDIDLGVDIVVICEEDMIIVSNVNYLLEERLKMQKSIAELRKTKVRLHNTKLGITTVWDMNKFELRLEQMRELYEGDCETDSDDLFYDPEDNWEKDLTFSPTPPSRIRSVSQRTVSTPKLQELPPTVPKSLQELLTSQVSSSPLSSSRRCVSSEIVSTPVSEVSQSSMSSRLDNLDETFLKDLLKDIPAVPTICRTIMSAALSHLDGDVTITRQRTFADRVLEQCQSLKVAATTVLQSFDSHLCTGRVPFCETSEVRGHCIQSSVALELMVDQAVQWTTEQGERDTESKLTRELKTRLKDTTRRVGVNMARLMQHSGHTYLNTDNNLK
ncbi:uncharacterized protein LOC134191579 [Corticium candelabrum]|uniref:uncharacterized protein LOC134191579 n=1 Tax=Corticium candelabrum TaxID=121492 RepID=UPI002E252A51|nr:uncharacterized protein LOC134191579 [Corticium candelabrum]